MVSAQAVEGSQGTEWEGRTPFLYFQVGSLDAQTGEETEAPLTFMGKRVRTDTCHWSGAVIQG